MSTKRILIAGIAALTTVVTAGFVTFNLAFTNNTAPSGPATAIPLVVNTAAPNTQATTVSTTTSAPGSTAGATALPAQDSGLVIFQIVPDQSQVSFSIYEELGGQPRTVVGVSSQVAGQLAVGAKDLSQTQVGVIQVNARTLVTHRFPWGLFSASKLASIPGAFLLVLPGFLPESLCGAVRIFASPECLREIRVTDSDRRNGAI